MIDQSAMIHDPDGGRGDVTFFDVDLT